MASSSARRLVQRSTSYAKAFMSSAPRSISPPSVASGPSKLGGLAPTIPSPAPPLSRRRNLFFTARLPKELGCGDSLMPLHSVTASALLKSLLSSEVGQWACLSEGTNQFPLNFTAICNTTITGPLGPSAYKLKE